MHRKVTHGGAERSSIQWSSRGLSLPFMQYSAKVKYVVLGARAKKKSKGMLYYNVRDYAARYMT